MERVEAVLPMPSSIAPASSCNGVRWEVPSAVKAACCHAGGRQSFSFAAFRSCLAVQQTAFGGRGRSGGGVSSRVSPCTQPRTPDSHSSRSLNGVVCATHERGPKGAFLHVVASSVALSLWSQLLG